MFFCSPLLRITYSLTISRVFKGANCKIHPEFEGTSKTIVTVGLVNIGASGPTASARSIRAGARA